MRSLRAHTAPCAVLVSFHPPQRLPGRSRSPRHNVRRSAPPPLPLAGLARDQRRGIGGAAGPRRKRVQLPPRRPSPPDQQLTAPWSDLQLQKSMASSRRSSLGSRCTRQPGNWTSSSTPHNSRIGKQSAAAAVTPASRQQLEPAWQLRRLRV